MTGHPIEKIKKDMSRAVWKSFLGDDRAGSLDGVEGDAAIQDERAAKLISTQVPGFLSFGA